jgi:DNA-binding response OmpR family regulator
MYWHMPNQRILLIEDDPAIRQGVTDALRFAGYQTLQAANVPDGLDTARGAAVDLILLDLVLPGSPGQGGLDILRDVRSTRPTLPVIIMTARGEESERVLGLKLGADDYVVKPFGIKEMLARVEAVLRRSPQRPVDVREVKLPSGAVADLARCEVRFPTGQRAELSEKEMELLRYLATNPDRAITREELLSCVWRIDPRGAETRTIDMHVARLREKLHDDPADPQIILTVRGKGYAFAPPKVTPNGKTK